MTLFDLKKALAKRLPKRSNNNRPNEARSTEMSPQQLYQELKQEWFFHKSSWYMRGKSSDDGKGCDGSHCEPECEFYPDTGRVVAKTNQAS